MTTNTVLSPRGNSKPPYGSFAGKSPFVPSDSKSFVRNFTVLGLGGYSRPLWGSFAGKTASTVVPVVLPDSFARGGGATKKQLKKYQQNEERFQRQRRELERNVFETMGKPKASLKNTAELGGPKVIEIDDDPDDYDIMMWAAQ